MKAGNPQDKGNGQHTLRTKTNTRKTLPTYNCRRGTRTKIYCRYKQPSLIVVCTSFLGDDHDNKTLTLIQEE